MENRYALRGQSDAYAKARKELLDAEIALRDQRERVAELRRALPPGPEMPDYAFREGPADLITTSRFSLSFNNLNIVSIRIKHSINSGCIRNSINFILVNIFFITTAFNFQRKIRVKRW